MRDEDRPTRWLYRLGHERPRPAEEVRWEIEHYLAEQTDRLVEEGWKLGAARREAQRRFGALDCYRPRMERIHRRRMMMRKTGMVLDAVMDGLRDAGRTFRRSPGFALGVVLTLALGLGANTAMFSIVDRLLLRPPDHIAKADQVRRVAVTRHDDHGGTWTQEALAYPDVLDLERAGSFDVAAYGYAEELTLTVGADAVSVDGRMASHDFFSVLGAPSALGRFFTEDEDRPGAALTAVLSHELWTSRFGADTGILGRSIELGGDDYTVIGVTPRGFTGVTLEPVDLWLPLEPTMTLRGGSTEWRDQRFRFWISAVVRLNAGTTVEAATEKATALHLAGRRENIRTDGYDPDALVELRPLVAAADTPEGRVATWLLGVALVVLLIGCANVANLLLARGARRRNESAVRLALGVSWRRLALQQTLEAVFLSLSGGVVALLVAYWGAQALAAVLLPDVLFPSILNPRVLAFTAVVSLLAGGLAGLGPVLQGREEDLAKTMVDRSRGSSGRRSRARSTLAMTQAALSALLLVGAGLFVVSLGEVRSLDLGLEVDHLVLAQLELSTGSLTNVEETALYVEAADRVREVPGVQSATITQTPFRSSRSTSIRVAGLDSVPRMPGGGPYYFPVGAGYFETVGLELLQGRGIEESDRDGSQPVTVVSENMADSLWDGSPLGRCVFVGDPDDEECYTVVGVVENASRGSLQTDPYFAWYLPIAQTGGRSRGLYVRTTDDPEDLKDEIASTLRSFSPQVRFARVEGLREILDPQARSWRLGATMFTVFGILALLVATVGLYSLLAFSVAQRTRELGIRAALGAERGRLLGSVVFQGTRLVVAGVLLGLGAAWVAAPFLEDLLFEVRPRDPAVLGGVAGVLVVVGLAASLVPGLRATRVDPIKALNTE